MNYVVVSSNQQNSVQVSKASVPEINIQIPDIKEISVQGYGLPADITQGPPGNDVPAGGLQYQVIVKQSSTPQDTSWEYPDKTIFEVRNDSGDTLNSGDVVYAIGEVGSSGVIRVDKCDCSDSSKMPAIGIVKDSIADNANGLIVAQGIFKPNINVGGFSNGDNAYVSTAGTITPTKPVYPNLIQNIGTVLQTNGNIVQELKVSSIDRTNDVPNLSTGKIFLGSATNTVESPYTLPTTAGTAGQVLQSDGTNIILGDAAAGVTNLTTTQTSATEVVVNSDTGTDATIAEATATVAGVMTAADKTKLDAVDVNAEQNVQSDWGVTDTSDDAYIIGKPNVPEELTDLTDVTISTPASGDILVRNSAGQFVNAAIVAGSGITIVDNDGSITINSTGGGGGTFDQDYTLNIPTINGVTKTFGKYVNGDTVASTGLTATEVIIDAWTDAVEPTPTFTFTGKPDWNHPAAAATNYVTISIPNSGIINNVGGTGTAVLEYQLGTSSTEPTGTWTNTNLVTTLSYGGSGSSSYQYELDSTIAYSTSNYFWFRLRVQDSTSGTSEQTHTSFCQAQTFNNPEIRIDPSVNLVRLSALTSASGGSNTLREIGDYQTRVKWEVRRDEVYGPLDTSSLGLRLNNSGELFQNPSYSADVSAATLSTWYGNASTDVNINSSPMEVEGGVSVDLVNYYDNNGNSNNNNLQFFIELTTNVAGTDTVSATPTVSFVPSFVICFDTTALDATATDAQCQAVLDAFGTDDDGVAVRKLYSGTTSSSYPAVIGTTPTFTVQSNGEYLYLFYPGSTDVSNFLLNGVEGVNGAFLHIGTRDLQNRYGYEQTYNVYRSNAPNAFNGDYLIIN